MTRWLYSSRGEPIAFVHGEYVFSSTGRFVGRIDGTEVWHGNYIGEIVDDDRFLRRRGTGKENVNRGRGGTPGSPGVPGRPGNKGGHGLAGNFADVDLSSKS